MPPEFMQGNLVTPTKRTADLQVSSNHMMYTNALGWHM